MLGATFGTETFPTALHSALESFLLFVIRWKTRYNSVTRLRKRQMATNEWRAFLSPGKSYEQQWLFGSKSFSRQIYDEKKASPTIETRTGWNDWSSLLDPRRVPLSRREPGEMIGGHSYAFQNQHIFLWKRLWALGAGGGSVVGQQPSGAVVVVVVVVVDLVLPFLQRCNVGLFALVYGELTQSSSSAFVGFCCCCCCFLSPIVRLVLQWSIRCVDFSLVHLFGVQSKAPDRPLEFRAVIF